jgi:hypothetical protein
MTFLTLAVHTFCQRIFQKATTLDFLLDLTSPLSSPSFTSSTPATTTCAAHEGAVFSDSLRNTNRFATDVWLVGALHGKQASAGVGLLGLSFLRSSSTTALHCLFPPRDNSKEVVATRRHHSSSTRKASRTLGLSPPPSTVLVWRPARRFERSWRKPRGGTVRRKVSFFPATLLVKRVWP